MDTKLKKFSRSIFTKAVAFVLAVLFFTLAANNVLSSIDKIYSDGSVYSYKIGDFFKLGKKIKLTQSRFFIDTVGKCAENAMKKAFIFGEGTMEDYERYQKKAFKIIGNDEEEIYFSTYNDFAKEAKSVNDELLMNKSLYYTVKDQNARVVFTTLKEKSTAQNNTFPLGETAWGCYYSVAEDSYYFNHSELPYENELDYSMRTSIEYGIENLPTELFKMIPEEYSIAVSFKPVSGGGDKLSAYEDEYSEFTSMFIENGALLLFCLALSLAFSIYLIVVAGKKPGDEKVHMLFTDKIFTLLRFAINGSIIAAAVICAIGALGMGYDSGRISSEMVLLICDFCAVAVMSALLDLLMYLSRHFKNRSLFKNLLLCRLLNSIINSGESNNNISKYFSKRALLLFLLPNAIIGLPCVLSLAFRTRYISYDDQQIFALLVGFLLAIYDLFAIGWAINFFSKVSTVFAALSKVRGGEAPVGLRFTNAPKPIMNASQDLLQINEGLTNAIDRALKDEKMRVALITNVSHDLKTPLTSIINYTDLLSRCSIEDETAKGYISVLSEKSDRLKRLIEDLVEASKASSGVIKVELQSVSLTELCTQIAGEYEDEFEARGLQLVFEPCEESITSHADSKLCYRIMDNLMGNIKKYAMQNTRVYLSIQRADDYNVIVLRNISANELNIPISELRERFVRGSSSRTGEGSGLGLSIANDLCALQGGKLELEIRGDLFEARVLLKSV